MRPRIILLAALLLAIFAWPPVYYHYFASSVQSWLTGHGKMKDYEIQKLLAAQRWVIDVPKDKDGWYLAFETEIDGDVKTYGGTSVLGGTRIVLLTRRNSDSKKIEYAWYGTETVKRTETEGHITFRMNLQSSGSGSIADPLVAASVSVGRPDGDVKIGEPIYRGGRESVQGFPGPRKADFEVRVVLTPPI